LALPVASKVLQLTATGSTTTANEQDPVNNAVTLTPVFNYPSNTFAGGDVLISMCTGTNLSSFFECDLFTSSQQHHIFTLNADTTVSVYGQTVGTWDRPSPTQIHLYMVNGGTVIEHNGYASGIGPCFEGKTTFTPSPSGYMSIYKICPQ
jgi:hypothetical protein